jgi:peptide/nickel transport system permease protein
MTSYLDATMRRRGRQGRGIPREASRPEDSSHVPSGPELLIKDPAAIAGVSLLLILAIAAIAAPLILPWDPSVVDLSRRAVAPSPEHLLGTDSLGRDLLARAVYGARVSLGVGLGAAAASALLGLTLGLIAGYWGGWRDAVISRLVDASLAVPAFFVLVALQALLGGGSTLSVVLVISLVGWMPVARVVRAQTLSLKQQEFVLAARALGCPGPRIIRRHLLPNLTAHVTVLYTLGVADALLMESALSFMGFGVPPTEASWGNMLRDAHAAILSGMWWVVIVPGSMILATALAINFVGDRLGRATASWPSGR